MLKWKCSRGSRQARTSLTSRTELRASGKRRVRWGSANDLLAEEGEDIEEAGDISLCLRVEAAEAGEEDVEVFL